MRNPLVWVTVLACVIVALAELAGHWFPWRVLPGAADGLGRLRRVLAYGYGTLTILIGMTIWAWVLSLVGQGACSVWAAVLALAFVSASAGLGTLGAYAIDLVHEHQALRGDVADYEQTHDR